MLQKVLSCAEVQEAAIADYHGFHYMIGFIQGVNVGVPDHQVAGFGFLAGCGDQVIGSGICSASLAVILTGRSFGNGTAGKQ